MSANRGTGIIRRIDDLGRVVIPKEIRSKTGIHEDDPLEIMCNEDGEIILRLYRPSTFSDEINHVNRRLKNFGLAMDKANPELKEEYQKAADMIKQSLEIMKEIEQDRQFIDLLYDYDE